MSCTQDSGFTGPAVILDEGLGIMSQGYEGPLKMGGLWTRLTGGREGESRTERGGSVGGQAEEKQPTCGVRPAREACFRRGQPGSESGGARGQGLGCRSYRPGPGGVGPARVLGPELDGGERGKRGRGSEDSTARDMLQGKGSVQSRGGRRAC